MSVNLNSRIDVGVTPFGQRNWISFSGGSWSGTWGNGIVMVSWVLNLLEIQAYDRSPGAKISKLVHQMEHTWKPTTSFKLTTTHQRIS